MKKYYRLIHQACSKLERFLWRSFGIILQSLKLKVQLYSTCNPPTPKITTIIWFLQKTDGKYSLDVHILSFSILTYLMSVFTQCLQNARFLRGYKRHRWHNICLAPRSKFCGNLRKANHEVKNTEFTHQTALLKGSPEHSGLSSFSFRDGGGRQNHVDRK